MLSLSIGTLLLMSLLIVGVIVLTEILKKQDLWSDCLWNIPAACLIAAATLLVYELIADPPFTVADGAKIIIAGLIIGNASGGLYRMFQGFTGKKK